MLVVSPTEFSKFVRDPKYKDTLIHLETLADKGKACCDCNSISSPLLPCSRNIGKTSAQCIDCANSYSQWAQMKITKNDLQGIYATRKIFNTKKFLS